MPRVVLITNDSMHGQRVLQRVYERGIMLDAVLYLTGSLGMPAPRGVGLAGRLLRWPRAAAGTMRRTLKFHRKRKPSYAVRCTRVVAAGAMNSRTLLRHLRALAPDWIVLGGGGILRPEVIETARVGVLNVHPALLPWIRGVGVTGASLDAGVPLGATLHYVNRGIDTGALIERRLLHVGAEARALADLDVRAWELAAEMMADAVEAIVRRGEVPAGVAQPMRYPLHRWPGEEEMRRHVSLAEAGRAHELYEAWRSLCIDGERNILPAEAFDPPTPLVIVPLATDPG